MFVCSSFALHTVPSNETTSKNARVLMTSRTRSCPISSGYSSVLQKNLEQLRISLIIFTLASMLQENPSWSRNLFKLSSRVRKEGKESWRQSFQAKQTHRCQTANQILPFLLLHAASSFEELKRVDEGFFRDMNYAGETMTKCNKNRSHIPCDSVSASL